VRVRRVSKTPCYDCLSSALCSVHPLSPVHYTVCQSSMQEIYQPSCQHGQQRGRLISRTPPLPNGTCSWPVACINNRSRSGPSYLTGQQVLAASRTNGLCSVRELRQIKTPTNIPLDLMQVNLSEWEIRPESRHNILDACI
jgi:hypothetical protein